MEDYLIYSNDEMIKEKQQKKERKKNRRVIISSDDSNKRRVITGAMIVEKNFGLSSQITMESTVFN